MIQKCPGRAPVVANSCRTRGALVAHSWRTRAALVNHDFSFSPIDPDALPYILSRTLLC